MDQAQSPGAENFDQSRPDYQAIFDALPCCCLVLSPNEPTYTVIAVNEAYAQALLIKPAELIGRGLFEVLPEALEERVLRASLAEVRAKKLLHSIAIHKNGRYWKLTSTPLVGSDGELKFIIHQTEDVTEVEEKLLAAEARHGLAFEQAPVGMVLLTPDGKITAVNQAYVAMLGYGMEELESGDSTLFTHPDDVPATRHFFQSLREGPHNSGSIEKRYFRKDGAILWACASAAIRRDDQGRPAQVVAIVEDITARKRAEARYRFLAESIPQMVWTATPDGTLDYVNGQATDYFGVSQDALLKDGWLAWVHPEDREQAAGLWKESVETGKRYEAALRLKRKSDGSCRWHLVRALSLQDDEGRLIQWFGTCTDIEDQKQADARLLQQWTAFDAALSHTPDFTYTFDLRGRFTYINRALLTLWQKTLTEALGKNFFELGYPAPLAERLQRQIQEVIDTALPIRDQASYTGAAGKAGYYDYIFVPVLDGNGRVKAVAGSTRDFTEQNQIAQRIEEDRRRWRELLVQAPAGIAVLRGPAHRFEWVNADYARLVSRSPEWLSGKTVSEALPEIEQQDYLKLLDNVYQSGEPFKGHELLVQLNDQHGALRDSYVNFVYLPTRDGAGEIDGIFVHVIDVTEMVVARKRVEDSERQFRTLAETIPHLAWMADERGNRFWYNRRWYDFTGTNFEDVKDLGWTKVHDPGILAEITKRWQEALACGDPFELVHPLKARNGSFRSFLTRVEPVRNDRGQVVRWFGTNTDITEQRRIEDELRRINRELEEFAYVASHDLQEPLRMVNIYTQLILKAVGAGDEKLDQYGAFVREGVDRMEALIKGLLTFSRTVHSEELPVETADLEPALTEAMAVLKDRIAEAEALITAGDLPVTRGNTEQISHVFQNIVSNALKYRKKNMRPEIHISAARKEDRWVVSVRDNGIGFEPQYSERIFGLFKRLHKDEYPGTGLGLAICKRIVERYGGQMWAEGELGIGATIHFSLPCVTER